MLGTKTKKFSDMPYPSCEEKQKKLIEQFSSCDTPEKIYAKVMELGRELPPYPPALKTTDHLVKGCQSQLYLHTDCRDGKLIFQVHSDALISAGLAALLLAVYNNESPEAILHCPPTFLKELDLIKHLTPGRANGMASLLSKMRAAALLQKHHA